MSEIKRIVASLVFYGSVLLCGHVVVFVTLLRWALHPWTFWKVKKRDTPPTCLLDPELGTHSYIHLKDIKLHYVEKGDRDKPLMVFLHGFPEFWYSWRHQIKEFSREYWVVALDLRGYGESDKPRGKQNYELPVLAEDIIQFIKALGRTKCILVGHDWGGILGWEVIEKNPELIERFIAMNIPHPRAFRKHIRSSLKQCFMSWYIMVFQIPWLPEHILRAEDLSIFDNIFKKLKPGCITAEDIEAFKYTYREPDAFYGPLNYYRNIIKGLSGFKDVSEDKVKVPTLMIFGDKDLALDSKMAHMSVAYVENFTLKMIEGISHWVQQEAPEEVNAHMWEYLKA